MTILESDVARTLTVLRQMAEGKTLTIGDTEWGMRNDMEIGPVSAHHHTGQQVIYDINVVTLGEFHKILAKHNIVGVLP